MLQSATIAVRGPGTAGSLRGQARVRTPGVCVALMTCARQITTKSGHISDVDFEPQPPLLIDDETPNDQVQLHLRFGWRTQSSSPGGRPAALRQLLCMRTAC
jgi:hypothetical protein